MPKCEKLSLLTEELKKIANAYEDPTLTSYWVGYRQGILRAVRTLEDEISAANREAATHKFWGTPAQVHNVCCRLIGDRGDGGLDEDRS